MKFFNNAGPIVPKMHYCLDPIERIDKDEILKLIEQHKYFVLHAPRQTGKTSSLIALRDYLNAGKLYHCVYVNVEDAQMARDDIETGIRTIIASLANEIGYSHKNLARKFAAARKSVEKLSGTSAWGSLLNAFCMPLDKPLVLLIDEIDSLVGDTLISVLRQIRSGYPKRPKGFPQSIVLCGVRDVRDYRIHSDEGKAIITGGSAFNIKAESIRLGDFSRDDIKELYMQHTKETGQKFETGVFEYVWELTEGQPWLVNTLAYEACFKIEKDPKKAVTMAHIEQAKENIIMRRDTHIDSLIHKLREDRVRKVIGPMLAGEKITFSKKMNAGSKEETPVTPDDVQYVVDLGLIKARGSYVISNAIYKEIIPRELVYVEQRDIVEETSWYIEKGRLKMGRLLENFQQFFRENSEAWLERFDYKEAGPHLLLMAFLQRVINGGGRIFREYGLGMKRMDLLVEFGKDRFAIELKVKCNANTEKEGIKQLEEYMDRSGAAEGHLVIFNVLEKSWKKRIFTKKQKNAITVWGM
ncbi:MAG: hypothetical protein BWY32_01325 [bacterium ADurb.Bin243]|nr:MAG: hypothetical protein BWY32_01325 [bacterium ADurb.Bin243]HOD41016.1 AAA-like domain-containing protein [Candidatus Wallbacteria bacterium]